MVAHQCSISSFLLSFLFWCHGFWAVSRLFPSFFSVTLSRHLFFFPFLALLLLPSLCNSLALTFPVFITSFLSVLSFLFFMFFFNTLIYSYLIFSLYTCSSFFFQNFLSHLFLLLFFSFLFFFNFLSLSRSSLQLLSFFLSFVLFLSFFLAAHWDVRPPM